MEIEDKIGRVIELSAFYIFDFCNLSDDSFIHFIRNRFSWEAARVIDFFDRSDDILGFDLSYRIIPEEVVADESARLFSSFIIIILQIRIEVIHSLLMPLFYILSHIFYRDRDIPLRHKEKKIGEYHADRGRDNLPE